MGSMYILFSLAFIYCTYDCFFERDRLWKQDLWIGELLGIHSSAFQRTEVWDQIVMLTGVVTAVCAVLFALQGVGFYL